MIDLQQAGRGYSDGARPYNQALFPGTADTKATKILTKIKCLFSKIQYIL